MAEIMLTNKPVVSSFSLMDAALNKLSTAELQERYKKNAALIGALRDEIHLLEANLTCRCAACLRPPPPLSTPVRGDVRSLDFAAVANRHGPFDVILMDPPWQLAGHQPTRGVALAYAQLADRDIVTLPIADLTPRHGNGEESTSLLFIWTINAKLPTSLSLFRKWGYRYIQDVAWVKRTVNRRLAKCHGYYLQHAKETCLVGIKGDPPPPHWNLGVANDVIYTERRGQSQKPIELYEMIERLIPGGRFLEIFGRRHNLRDHWTTIGNEL